MATWQLVSLDIKEAEVLADMAGIQDDLEASQGICDILLKGIEIKEAESVNDFETLTVRF